MNLVLLLVFGAIAGGVAKWLLPGKCPAGWVPTIVLGVIGSFVGGIPFGGALYGRRSRAGSVEH